MPYVRFQRMITDVNKENFPSKREFLIEYKFMVLIHSTNSRFVNLTVDEEVYSRVIPTSIKIIRKNEVEICGSNKKKN